MSIRRNLVVALLAALVLVGLFGAWAVYRSARDGIGEVMDYHLSQIALSLRNQTFPDAVPPPIEGNDEHLDFVIQIWDREGLSVYYSRPHRELPIPVRLGFSTVPTNEGAWRVYAVQLRDRTIQVAQPMKIRNQLATTAALRALVPFLYVLPLLGILVWLLVGRGLAPLVRLARAVAARTPTALEPIAEARVPREVQPLVHALDDLLARLKRAFDAQRHFVADAAHELRTPLAALQLQAQLVERARDAAERDAAIEEMKQGLQRATRTVQQLLTLARQDPSAVDTTFAPVNLGELVDLVIGEQRRLATEKQIRLDAKHVDDDAVVHGDAEALHILLSNLVENALRYTPNGGIVSVVAGRAPDGAFLKVSDSGPGIPVHERQHVFDRFYRGEGVTAPGTGLGLAIVKAVAERHEATLQLDDSGLGGLGVRVDFPAATPKKGP